MNNDLISRDALKKDIDFQYICECCHNNGNTCDICPVAEIEKKIDDAPTVPLPDFKEGYKQAILDGKTNFSRSQGKWELHGKRYYCSECGEEAINIESEPDMYSSNYCLTNYCPNCGADMRGKKHD